MQKALTVVENAFTFVSGLATVLIMLLLSFDAILRYVYRPIKGVEEITSQYLLVAAALLAVGYAYRRGGLIRVTIMTERLPRPFRLAADYFALIFSLACTILIFIATAKEAARMYEGGTVSNGVIPYPMWPAYSIVPVAMGLLVIMLLFDLPRLRLGKSSFQHEESLETQLKKGQHSV